MKRLIDLFLTFAKIGAFTFGGGYAMIALLDHECVEKKQWITEDEMSDMTVIAESTPGPIAINCATFAGYKQAGLPGAIAATLGMILPSLLIITAIATYFETLLSYPIVANAFRGIRVAVAVLIANAGIKMVKKMLKKTPSKPQSIAFVAVFFAITFALNLLGVHLSTIWLILAAGVCGYCLYGLPKKGVQK